MSLSSIANSSAAKANALKVANGKQLKQYLYILKDAAKEYYTANSIFFPPSEGVLDALHELGYTTEKTWWGMRYRWENVPEMQEIRKGLEVEGDRILEECKRLAEKGIRTYQVEGGVYRENYKTRKGIIRYLCEVHDVNAVMSDTGYINISW